MKASSHFGCWFSVVGGVLGVALSLGLTSCDEVVSNTANPAQRTYGFISGSWSSPGGKGLDGAIGLRAGQIRTDPATGMVHLTIELAGLIPTDRPNHLTFELLLDTDNNTATGSTGDPSRGADRIVEVTATGQFPFTAPTGSVVVRVVDANVHGATVIGSATMTRIMKFIESTDPSAPSSEPSNDELRVSIPFESLDIRVATLPAVVRSTNVQTGATDKSSFVVIAS